MKDKQTVFLDTNLLVYAHTNVDPPKGARVQAVIKAGNTVISTQILTETANVLYKKFRIPWGEISMVLDEMETHSGIHENTKETIQQACHLAERYGYSFYDSLVIASALATSCTLLYSEDMQHGQVIAETLTIMNPFI